MHASSPIAHIPTLDGWRGIAILLVLITHLQAGLSGHVYRGYRWLDLGQHGVTIFFVLSGYLITARLLEEERIDLKRFYMRRLFRLMPCAWVYLLSVVILGQVIRMPIIGNDIWPSLLFFRNYTPTADNCTTVFTVHFWSLSLEEQFYLAWPPVLFFAGRKWGLRIAGAGAAACAIFRYFHWASYLRFGMAYHIEVRADALLVGCALAILLKNRAVRSLIERNGVWLFCLCVPAFGWHIYRYQELIPLTESLLIAIMLAVTSIIPSFAISKALEYKHLRFLGTISYSVYVWQQLFLMPRSGGFFAFFLPAAALGSWVLIERPCIRFERRLERRYSAAHQIASPVAT
jgi:peptidoglycan/LPS O-acetylase OafA/YrhL